MQMKSAHGSKQNRASAKSASSAGKPNFVSFYLMPVYMYPELLENISPGLRKHMQGKSCFNFTSVEPELFAELEQLARRGVERYRQGR